MFTPACNAEFVHLYSLQNLPRMPNVHQDKCNKHRYCVEDVDEKLVVFDVVVD